MDFFLFLLGLAILFSSFVYLAIALYQKNLVNKIFFSLFAVGLILPVIGASIGVSNMDTTEETSEATTEEVEQTETEEAEVGQVKGTSTEKTTEEGSASDDVADVKEEKEEEVQLTPQQKMLEDILSLIDKEKAFDTGSYVKGSIPAGEYAYIALSENGYYCEEDSTGEIIDNGFFDSFGYVYVHSSGNLQTDGVLISTASFKELGVSCAKEIYETLNDVKDYQGPGWYKIGVDLSAGQYTTESTGDGGYVAIMSGPMGKSDIIDNNIFDGQYGVNVTNGQFLNVSDAKIIK